MYMVNTNYLRGIKYLVNRNGIQKGNLRHWMENLNNFVACGKVT
jgi:hypothetical protein